LFEYSASLKNVRGFCFRRLPPHVVVSYERVSPPMGWFIPAFSALGDEIMALMACMSAMS